MSRIYDRKLECGCLISSDGGGALMDCMSDNCKFSEWNENKRLYKNI